MTDSYLYPGGSPQHINRPAKTYSSGPLINQIDQRWLTLRANYSLLDPALVDFLERDVARLLLIARAAYAWSSATNAESYRQATQQLQSSLQPTNP